MSVVNSRNTLRTALAELLDGLEPGRAGQAVERLIANYRGTTPTDAPVLRDRSDVVAYAAYRMPATFEAVRAALAGLAAAAPDWAPASHVDVGGGTGAAVWAADATWGDRGGDGRGDGADTGTRTTTVLDWAEPALAVGRELAAASAAPALTAAAWRQARIGTALTLPDCDLVTVSYVLKELTGPDRAALVTEAARAARAVVVVEPGTPDGHLRIIEARERLVAAGLSVAAPCPHSGACPIAPGTDWCHFAARVSRSSLHRQVKGGSLPYEDEKFAYVAAVRFDARPAPARVTRKPQIRKGQVLLDLCTTGGSDGDGGGNGGGNTGGNGDSGSGDGLTRETVTKRHGALYRAARDTAWGDAWPPPDA
nr:small ribosomal subunit Rsm22 family protein [Streptomyces sp. NRRL F-5135]